MQDTKKLEKFAKTIIALSFLNLFFSVTLSIAISNHFFQGNTLLITIGSVLTFSLIFRVINYLNLLFIKIFIYKNDKSTFSDDLNILLKNSAVHEKSLPKNDQVAIRKEFIIGDTSEKIICRYKDKDVHEWIELIDSENNSRVKYYYDGIHHNDDYSAISETCIIIEPGIIYKSQN